MNSILENMNYYGPIFLCPSEMKISPALQKLGSDRRAGIFSSPVTLTSSKGLDTTEQMRKIISTFLTRIFTMNTIFNNKFYFKILSANTRIQLINPFTLYVLTWTLPSLYLNTSIVANRSFSRKSITEWQT